MERGHGTGIVGWIALILSILALGLAWMAYNRTGADLEQRIQDQVQESARDVEQGVQEGVQNLDEGPDGIDRDDTETPQQGTQTTPDTTTDQQTTPQ